MHDPKKLVLRYYNRETLCSVICADYEHRTVTVENNEEVRFYQKAFGNTPVPTWEQYEEFLESRCIPRDRGGLREYLDVIGVEDYDPLSIIRKTKGRMAEDGQWLEIAAEESV